MPCNGCPSTPTKYKLKNINTQRKKYSFHHFNCLKPIEMKLEAQWDEPVSVTCPTNQKQELPMEAMFFKLN
jgi:hypothetical protein